MDIYFLQNFYSQKHKHRSKPENNKKYFYSDFAKKVKQIAVGAMFQIHL